MRVAFFVDTFPFPSKTFILNQIIGLMDKGVDLVVFGREPENAIEINTKHDKYKIHDALNYPEKDIPSPLGRIIKIPYFLQYAKKMPKPFFRSLNFFKYGYESLSLKLLYETLYYLKNGNFDIIHAHFGPYGLYALKLIELGAICGKFITSFHGFDLSKYITTHGSAVYNTLFEKGDLFLPISNFWKEKLVKLGCDKNKIIVHRMGVDCDYFSYSPKKQYNSPVKLLSIGRLIDKKGFHTGIKAVKRLIDNDLSIKYNIIGNGPLYQELSKLILELGIDEHISLLGWKGHEEVNSYLLDSDILLTPSITAPDGDMEGIPTVLIEAMAMGRPVISTLHSGIPELIHNGLNGIMVPENNVIMLSKVIQDLYTNPDKMRSMAHQARKDVEKFFNMEKQNKKLIDIYSQLLE